MIHPTRLDNQPMPRILAKPGDWCVVLHRNGTATAFKFHEHYTALGTCRRLWDFHKKGKILDIHEYVENEYRKELEESRRMAEALSLQPKV